MPVIDPATQSYSEYEREQIVARIARVKRHLEALSRELEQLQLDITSTALQLGKTLKELNKE